MIATVQTHIASGIVHLKCAGRLVEGGESAVLQQQFDALLAETPYVILDLADIDFIDSSGLGLLVRMLNRARAAGGDLRVCAAPARIKEILRVTRLETILPPHASVSDAIEASYDHARSTRTLDRLATDVLCVAASRDVLAYVCEILRQAGHGVLSSDNLPDALMLLRAARPRAVVIDAELRTARAAEPFNTLADARAVIELPGDFSHRDAGEAGARLLDQVRAAIGR
jgi:anti-anti-sigma factor